MEALLLKSIHVTCVALSYTLFFLRGVWMLRGSPARQRRWVRVVPHLVDSLLLASAVALAAQGVFFYMAGVAATHNPVPWRSLEV